MASKGKDSGAKGKSKKDQMFDYLLDSDTDFMADVNAKAKEAFNKAYETLTAIVDGEVTDERFDAKSGEIIRLKVTSDTKVKAAKALKELTIDKLLSDRRDSGHDKDKGKGASLDDALKEIGKLKKKEKDARKKAEADRLAKEEVDAKGETKDGCKIVSIGGLKK
jgi:hypothetical protein